jgi:hypothetical protein
MREPFSDEMRRMLRVRLIQETCTAEMVASLYSMFRRSLQGFASTRSGIEGLFCRPNTE